MTQDRPTAAELVAAVREFLERDVMTGTEGRLQFHTRVSVNALGMVQRELEQAAAYERAEQARAAALLGEEGEARALEAELARRIRAGELDDRIDDVRAHIRATVREKLLVANPSYLPAPEGE